MQLQEFLTCLHDHELNPWQLENINRVIKISGKFHKEAGIPIPEISEIKSETLILESGHQPNFLPHSGTWKKPFLLDFFRKKLKNSLPLFGFADYNLSTAKILSQNRIPALTKTGSEKIGFKIPEKEKWKAFNAIEKPSEQEFEKEIEKIKKHYKGYCQMAKVHLSEIESNLNEIGDLMQESYKKAKNLSDLNAFIFSKICNEIWNLNILFFRYSDIQRENIFISEWKKIISNLSLYNKIYNGMVKEKELKNIPLVEENSFPFWYHCSCGGKVPLFVSSKICTGKCPSCQEDHEFSIESIEEKLPRMSIQAVSRNLIFSEGLGTSLFISGSGGGLRYGQISNEISKELKFNLPITLAWKSQDYYLGIIHKVTINELTKILETDPESLANKEKLNIKIKKKKEEFLQEIKESEKDKKSLQKYRGQLINLRTQLGIAKEIFSLTPSLLDQFISFGSEEILNFWNNTIENMNIEKHQGFYLIQKDIIQDNKTKKIYQNLRG